MGKILIITCLSLVLLAVASTPKETVLEIYNPYGATLTLEFKCDWKKNKFSFHRFVSIPGSEKRIIVLPDCLKKCQVWPKVTW